MGSRRLHSTTADAKFHVQAISKGPHPRAIGRLTESPPRNSELLDESGLHDPLTDFGIQLLLGIQPSQQLGQLAKFFLRHLAV
jgi:hypothetical protein